MARGQPDVEDRIDDGVEVDKAGRVHVGVKAQGTCFNGSSVWRRSASRRLRLVAVLPRLGAVFKALAVTEGAEAFEANAQNLYSLGRQLATGEAWVTETRNSRRKPRG